MENNYFVYIHILPDGKTYVGITNREPEKRWCNGRGYKENKAFFSSIVYYGWANIKHIILYSNLSKEEASQKEAELIKKFHSDEIEFGFNVQTGGVRGFTHNAEARKKSEKRLKFVGKTQNIEKKYMKAKLLHNPKKMSEKRNLNMLRKDIITIKNIEKN